MSAHPKEIIYLKRAWLLIAIGIFGFFVWAATAPLDSGAQAPGTVISDGYSIPIQSFHQGLVEEVLVKEGQMVDKDSPLIRLNSIYADSQKNTAKEGISSAQEQIRGVEQIIQARQAELKILQQQIHGVQSLVKEEFLPKNRLWELERNQLQVQSDLANQRTNLVRLQQILKDTQEKLKVADFDQAQTELRAPMSGTVVGLSVYNKGQIIQPNQKVMDILPQEKRLILEVRIPVHLIDKVHAQLPVELRFTSFHAPSTPRFIGQLETVSADRLNDPKTLEPYYLAYASVNPQQMESLPQYQIRAGMAADVFIKTGERSLLSYLLKPVTDRVRSAFREE